MMDEQDFLAFLRFSLEETAALPDCLGRIDWEALYQFAYRQAIIGVLFEGIKKIPAEQPHPARELLLSWMAMAQTIERRNRRLNAEIVRIVQTFRTRGFRSCLLKGQGNACLYPHPLCRTSGDIDLWVDGDRTAVTDFCREMDAEADSCYHHVKLHLDDVELEVHHTPSYAGNIFYNYRLQRYFKGCSAAQFAHTLVLPGETQPVSVPTDAFNRIFQLSHLMRHYLYEGVGLRQVIDYYYLLIRSHTDRMTPHDRQEEAALLRRLYLYRFARGLMWVLHHDLGLDTSYFIVEEEEKEGRLLRRMILDGGNFGYFDSRYQWRGRGRLGRYLTYLYRTSRFFTHYPAEALLGRPFMPVWRRIWERFR